MFKKDRLINPPVAKLALASVARLAHTESALAASPGEGIFDHGASPPPRLRDFLGLPSISILSRDPNLFMKQRVFENNDG